MYFALAVVTATAAVLLLARSVELALVIRDLNRRTRDRLTP